MNRAVGFDNRAERTILRAGQRRFGLLVLVGVAWCSLAGRAVAQGPKVEKEASYQESFQGRTRIPNDFYLIGKGATTCVKFEPEGMRITLPTGEPGERLGTGVQSRFGLRGDFEITVSYEILRETVPEDAGVQTRLTLGVNLDRPKPWLHQATLTRRVWGNRSTEYGTNLMLHDFADPRNNKVIRNAYPTGAKAGRLRLVRVGTEISYQASDGFDGPFERLETLPFVAEDARQIAIVGATGGAKAALDVRFTDLRIRAGALLRNMPPEKKMSEKGADLAEAAPAIAAPTGQPISPLDTPAAPAGRSGWLLPLLIAGAAGTLLLLAALGLWGYLHARRGRVEKGGSREAATVPFVCPECDRRIKVKAELAGKKVKCAQCGTAVLVPTLTRST